MVILKQGDGAGHRPPPLVGTSGSALPPLLICVSSGSLALDFLRVFSLLSKGSGSPSYKTLYDRLPRTSLTTPWTLAVFHIFPKLSRAH